MRWLFVLLIGLLAASDILGKDLSLGFGLSPKNLMLYLIALALFFRIALAGTGVRMRLPGLHVAFGVLVGYATLSFVTCCLIVHYASYDPRQFGLLLKSELYDAALFLFAVFYAIRDEADFRVLIKMLLGAIGLSSVLTLTDVVGITHLGVQIGQSGVEADRVFGMFGHANDTAALLVCLLPAMIAAALSSRGAARVLWYVAGLSTLAVLFLTVSRGAYVGFVIGYGAACVICKKYLPLSRVVAWCTAGIFTAVVLCVVISIAVPNIASVVFDRLVGQSSSLSLMEVSSGRTNIWSTTLGHMADEPVTFLTGFGWHVYDTRFVYATHNYYLDLWFNLGLPGVLSFLAVLYIGIAVARRAADRAPPELRRYMIAFVFGITAMAVSILFTNLTRPWPYIWLYMGITLSAASAVLGKGLQAEEQMQAAPAPTLRVARGVPGRLPGTVGAAGVVRGAR